MRWIANLTFGITGLNWLVRAILGCRVRPTLQEIFSGGLQVLCGEHMLGWDLNKILLVNFGAIKIHWVAIRQMIFYKKSSFVERYFYWK